MTKEELDIKNTVKISDEVIEVMTGDGAFHTVITAHGNDWKQKIVDYYNHFSRKPSKK